MSEPDCDICSNCKEHADFIETDDGYESECCGAGAYDVDHDFDMER